MGTADPALRETIARVVRQQVRDGDPAEMKAILARPCQEGHSAQEACRLLGCAPRTHQDPVGM